MSLADTRLDKRPASPSGPRWRANPAMDFWVIVRHGLLGGLISGLVFSAAASFTAVVEGKPWDVPLRLVAAVALGSSVLETGQPFWPMLVRGMGLTATGPRDNGVATVAAALVYTLVRWLSWFYLIAPVLGWPWFAQRRQLLPPSSSAWLQAGA